MSRRRDAAAFSVAICCGVLAGSVFSGSPAWAQARNENGGPVQVGRYQCNGGPAGNMKLSFLAGGRYANEQGSSGKFSQTGPTITFVGGPWAGFFGHVYPSGDVQLRTAPTRPSTMQCQRTR